VITPTTPQSQTSAPAPVSSSASDNGMGQPPAAPLYASPPSAPPAQACSNGMGVTGLVTGIIGACLAWVPGLGFILGLLGIVFGSIGWYYASQGKATNKGMSIAGLVLGIFAVAFWPLTAIITMASVVGAATS
jgi:hypothetical protein